MKQKIAAGVVLVALAGTLSACHMSAPLGTEQNVGSCAHLFRDFSGSPHKTQPYCVDVIKYQGRDLYCITSQVRDGVDRACDFVRFWRENPDLQGTKHAE